MPTVKITWQRATEPLSIVKGYLAHSSDDCATAFKAQKVNKEERLALRIVNTGELSIQYNI